MMIPNDCTATFLPIIRETVELDSIVYTDGFASYDVSGVSELWHSYS